MAHPRLPHWLGWLAPPVVIVLLLVAFWSWDWFIPLAERRASAALGRPVTIAQLDVRFGRMVMVTANDVRIANPPGFAADAPFAQAQRVVARVDLAESWRQSAFVVPEAEILKPVVEAASREDGSNNYTFDRPAPDPNEPSQLRIGILRVMDGAAHILLPHMETELRLVLNTRDEAGPEPGMIADITGTYAEQPITGHAAGGPMLALQKNRRWPVRAQLDNGPTRLVLEGIFAQPLALAGAELRLSLQGPDMAQLEKLIGAPMPHTPDYEVTARFDRLEGRRRFREITGRVGQSDINGELLVATTAERTDVEGTLQSRRVHFADLRGFLGEEPESRPSPEQPRARHQSRGRVLPDEPLDLSRLRTSDVRVSYRADSIIGQNVPFDSLRAELEVKDGTVHLRPITLGVGRGQIVGNITLTPAEGENVQAQADLQFQRLDLSRLMQATRSFEGAGSLNGRARIDGTGRSVAGILGAGNGSLTLGMSGGNLSALLVDLSGLRLANALVSALGMPERTPVQCFVGDLVLRRGILSLRTVLLDTEDVLIGATGNVNLGRERLEVRLRSESKSFTIGTLPTSMLISGSFRNPSVGPELGELTARGGAVAGLAALLAPVAALLPTIQLGIGEDNRCEAMIRRGGRPASR